MIPFSLVFFVSRCFVHLYAPLDIFFVDVLCTTLLCVVDGGSVLVLVWGGCLAMALDIAAFEV